MARTLLEDRNPKEAEAKTAVTPFEELIEKLIVDLMKHKKERNHIHRQRSSVLSKRSSTLSNFLRASNSSSSDRRTPQTAPRRN